MTQLTAKHTPGPWYADARNAPDAPAFPNVWSSPAKSLGLKHDNDDTCLICETVGSSEECKANAQLIAAAPDLAQLLKESTAGLKAARAIIDQINMGPVDNMIVKYPMIQTIDEQIAANRAALTKAGYTKG